MTMCFFVSGYETSINKQLSQCNAIIEINILNSMQ